MVTKTGDRTIRYGNLLYVLLVFQSTTWWLDSGANVHVCSDASLLSSYHVTHDSSVMNENESLPSIHGVGTVDLKLTLRKRFDIILISANFNVNEVDRCVYYCHGGNHGVILNIKLIKGENTITLT
jgi:hypothetical protein